MAYSTIIKKKCKQEGCKKWPKLSLDGWCWDHASEEKREKYKNEHDLTVKDANRRKAISVKIRAIATPKDETTGETFKQAWFRLRRREMTGICACGCGLPSSKYDDANFRSSICHILPQKYFESVQFHPLNWIEMNFWEGHHTNFDGRGSDRWPQLKCWPLIVERFQAIYPLTYEEERKHIPAVLMATLAEAPHFVVPDSPAADQ